MKLDAASASDYREKNIIISSLVVSSTGKLLSAIVANGTLAGISLGTILGSRRVPFSALL